MVERGERAVSSVLASRVAEAFEVPATALPLTEYRPRVHDAGFFQAMLGGLGYPGFCLSARLGPVNPVELADGRSGLGRSGLAGHRSAGMAASCLPASGLGGLADRNAKLGIGRTGWHM